MNLASSAWIRLWAGVVFIRGEGGYTGNTRVPYATKHLLAIAFFWDTSPFIAVRFKMRLWDDREKALARARADLPGISH